MNIVFYEPPVHQRLGGLDQAIRSLQDYLQSAGHRVQTNPPRAASLPLPDIVHFHGLWQWSHWHSSRHCQESTIPYIVSPHGMLEPWAWQHKQWKKLPYYHLLEKQHLRGAAIVLATSDQEAANLARFVSPHQIAIIPLGLTSQFKPDWSGARSRLGWQTDELILLYLSRLHPKKGLHLLLAALVEIGASLPQPWRLVVVGDGEPAYTAQCRALLASHPTIFPHVDWKGAIWGEAKWDYYQAADLFCLPTYSENFGLAVLEAAQVGTRVLTTPYTPWALLAESGAAFLVEPEVASIIAGLQRFLPNRAWTSIDREQLSAMVFDRFAWRVVGEQYLQLYHSLTGGVCALNRDA